MTTTAWPSRPTDRLTADYSNPTRHFLPRPGDLVRLASGDKDWRWHGIVDRIETERDGSAPDGITVAVFVRPARVFEPLHGEWRAHWTRPVSIESTADYFEAVPVEPALAAVSEHALEVCVVNHCNRDGVGWVRYGTDKPFRFFRS